MDGKAYTAAVVEDIRQRTQNGEKCVVVFDIDDTLSDSRGRTLEFARAWDPLEPGRAQRPVALARAGLHGLSLTEASSFSPGVPSWCGDTGEGACGHTRDATTEPTRSVATMPSETAMGTL